MDVKTVAIAVRRALRDTMASTNVDAFLSLIKKHLSYHQGEFSLIEKAVDAQVLACFITEGVISPNDQRKHIRDALKLLKKDFSKDDCLFVADAFCRAKGWEFDVASIAKLTSSKIEKPQNESPITKGNASQFTPQLEQQTIPKPTKTKAISKMSRDTLI